jgi:hypothetical protein
MLTAATGHSLVSITRTVRQVLYPCQGMCLDGMTCWAWEIREKCYKLLKTVIRIGHQKHVCHGILQHFAAQVTSQEQGWAT